MDGQIFSIKSPLGCATLLPVKFFQISGGRKIFLKSGRNFTGKSVAQASVLIFIFSNTEQKMLEKLSLKETALIMRGVISVHRLKY